MLAATALNDAAACVGFGVATGCRWRLEGPLRPSRSQLGRRSAKTSELAGQDCVHSCSKHDKGNVHSSTLVCVCDKTQRRLLHCDVYYWAHINKSNALTVRDSLIAPWRAAALGTLLAHIITRWQCIAHMRHCLAQPCQAAYLPLNQNFVKFTW